MSANPGAMATLVPGFAKSLTPGYGRLRGNDGSLMFAFILRRAALIVPTFIGVTLLAFALIHLIPGDPVENLSGERGMDPARRERLLHEFGLDRALPLQYAEYIAQVVKGDLGTSL